ncbi:MAG TPA: hypothetical protein VEK73_11245 [Xanthobacteraceae bacterium]|nr:hypothetical protein [Xanthobacteraceae bacterium]
MVHRSFNHEASEEHRRTHTKWARAAVIAYGGALLLLVGIIVTQRALADPSRDAGASTASIAPIDLRAP